VSFSFGFGAGRRASKAAATYDPAVLSLTGWWRASYDGSGTWSGTASAGSSGTHGLLEIINKPAAGTAVNGRTPATFDGVNDFLGGSAFSTYATGTAYGGWALIKIASISTNNAAPSLYDNVTVWSNGAYGGLVLRSNNTVTLFHFDGGQQGVAASFTTSAWQLVQWKYDGTNGKIRVNAGSWSSTAMGTLADLTSTFYLSKRYDGTADFGGDVLDVGLIDSAPSDATFDNILLYARSYHALALT